MLVRNDQIGAEFSQHKQLYLGMALKRLRNRDDAKDAVQDAFLLAIRHFHQFDASRPLKPWIMKILFHVIFTMLRERKRGHQAIPAVVEISLDAIDAADLDHNRALQTSPVVMVSLPKFIDALPTSQQNKEVLHLQSYGHDQKKTAEQLQLKEWGVSRIIKKTRKLAARELEKLRMRYSGFQIEITW